MGWFTKKENVPEIPMAPRLPDLPETSQAEQKLPELPSFPNNSYNDQLNNELVKSAVGDSSVDLGEVLKYPGQENHKDFREKEVKVEELPRDFKLSYQTKQEQQIEQPAEEPKQQEKRTLELAPSMLNESKTKNYEPIFIKIDKFNSAQSDFIEIKKKINEFENTLRKVKELKTREDSEIQEWIEDFEKIKSHLSEIDNNIFSRA